MNHSKVNEEAICHARVDLAAAFRWFARMNMHESVANHLSVAVSPDGKTFLINPRGRHFSRMRASDLLLVDADDENTLAHIDAPDPTAWHIHGRLHARLPHARCLMHLHPKYATALTALEVSTIPPIDQNTMRFYKRVAIDTGFDGMALSAPEGDRLAEVIGNNNVLLMGNHGVLIAETTVARAFDEMYYLERACETLVTCYSTGQPLRVVPAHIAKLTMEQWSNYAFLADDHLREIKTILDSEEPSYRE